MLNRRKNLEIEDVAHAEFLISRSRKRVEEILGVDQMLPAGDEMDAVIQQCAAYRMALGKSMQINRYDNEIIRALRMRLANALRIIHEVNRQIRMSEEK